MAPVWTVKGYILNVMKPYLLVFGLLLLAPLLRAQTTTIEPTGVKFTSNNVEVPSVVVSRFNTGYPNVNPSWSFQDEVYMAQYRENDTFMKHVVTYDSNGNLISAATELTNDNYPVAISNYYAKKYPQEKYVVWSYEDASGNKKYSVKRDQQALWFDRNGKYIPDHTPGEKNAIKRKSAQKIITSEASTGRLLFFAVPRRLSDF